MFEHRRTILAAAVVLLMASPAHANRYAAGVTLEFTPTTAIGVAEARLLQPIERVPVSLVFEDGRPPDRTWVLGTRTDDDDLLYDIALENDLLGVAAQGLGDTASSWGVHLGDTDAERTLVVTITQAQVTEVNQVVGATYKSAVSFSASLRDAAGAELWQGTAKGATSRYGKPASNGNACEVVSDALVEAFARLISIPALQAAWVGAELASDQVSPALVGAHAEPPPPAPAQAAPTADSRTPEALLGELLELKQSGFSDDTLIQFLDSQALSRAMSAADMIAWKDAGLGEGVVQKALALPVR